MPDELDVKPVLIRLTPEQLHARRDHALATVGLTEAELAARVDPSPAERIAWQEVETVNFLLRSGCVGRLVF